jgi:hypothetical protein
MRSSWRMGGALLALACAALAGAPAEAGAGWSLRYTRGYDFVPNPPLASGPTTFVLHGIFPTGCGAIEAATVLDPAHVAIRLRSDATCASGPDSMLGYWSQAFELGTLAAGDHTLTVTLTMDRPDSGLAVHEGTIAFGVEDSTGSPPDSSDTPPPPPGTGPLLATTITDPYPPTPDRPVALIVAGYAPFACPVVSDPVVIDSTRIALTLSPGPACEDTTSAWSQRFELGVPRAGHHVLDLAIAIGDSVVHVPVRFLVVVDPTGWTPPPSDSLENVLSPSRPNPFAAESRFSVSLDNGVDAEVSVFDVHGRRVRRIFRGRFERGTTELAWDGRRDDGARATAGIYFYRITMPGRTTSTRLVLLPQP